MLVALVVAAAVTASEVDIGWVTIQFVSLRPFLIVVGLVLLAVWLGRGMLLAQQRVNSVMVSPTQFPEAYEMVQQAARRIGMDPVPQAYVIQGGGLLNAFASAHGRRRFIVLYADLFEVGGRLKDPETLRFIVAHELGHIAARHVSFGQALVSSIVWVIPPIAAAWSRAREYTADNHGYLVAPRGASGMTVLAAGKYLYPTVDFEEMAARNRSDRDAWTFLVNLFSTHPVLVKRFAALADRSRPGEIF